MVNSILREGSKARLWIATEVPEYRIGRSS